MIAAINKAIAGLVGLVVAVSFFGLTLGIFFAALNHDAVITYLDLTGVWATYFLVGIGVVYLNFFVFLGAIAVHTANYYQMKEMKLILEDIRDGRNAYNTDSQANKMASRVDPSL